MNDDIEEDKMTTYEYSIVYVGKVPKSILDPATWPK
jgi:hypothetical protein